MSSTTLKKKCFFCKLPLDVPRPSAQDFHPMNPDGVECLKEHIKARDRIRKRRLRKMKTAGREEV